MYFQKSVQAFDYLHSRAHGGRFEGDIGNSVNFDTGRDFYPQRRIPWQRQESGSDCADVCCVLWLQVV
jgi:hypothetical protein